MWGSGTCPTQAKLKKNFSQSNSCDIVSLLKCKTCANFDFCEACFYSRTSHKHGFSRIGEPGSAAVFAGRPGRARRGGHNYDMSGGGGPGRVGKNPGLKKNQPSEFFCFFCFFFGFLGYLGVFWVFFGCFWFLLYICPEERVFSVFSGSRILLGASRL
jgi:hypothetical protein